MSCFGDGQPLTVARFRLNDQCINGSAETISINFVAPCELQMEQLTAHWEAVPAISESLILSKLSVVNTRYNTVLRDVDPSAGEENITDLVCVIPFRWAKGDTVNIVYPNSNDQDVGVEIMLVQVK